MSVTFISHGVGKAYYSESSKFVIYLINQDDEDDEIWDTAETEDEAKSIVKSSIEDYGDSPEFQFRYEVK